MQFEGAREPRAARRAARPDWPKTGPKAKARVSPGPLCSGCCCARARRTRSAEALARLLCPGCHGAVRCSRAGAARGTTARRRALQPGRRSTAQSQHGAARYNRGAAARRRALQQGRRSTAQSQPGALQHGAVRCSRGGAARRSHSTGHCSTAPCAAAREFR
jgi:hypothetical protein